LISGNNEGKDIRNRNVARMALEKDEISSLLSEIELFNVMILSTES